MKILFWIVSLGLAAFGNEGSHFVNQALKAGYKIKAFVRSPEKYTLSENLKVEVVKGCKWKSQVQSFR